MGFTISKNFLHFEICHETPLLALFIYSMNQIDKKLVKREISSDMRKLLFLGFFYVLVSCSPGGHIIAIQKVEVAPFVDFNLSEIILISFSQKGLNQKDYMTVLESMRMAVRQRGFQDIWDIDENEIELKANGVNDFTLKRNIQRLNDNLGVSYYLEMEILNRKPFKISNLTTQLQYREMMDPNSRGGLGLGSGSEHITLTRYTLYRTDGAILLANLEISSRHLDNNYLDSKVIQKEVEAVFQQIFINEF